MTKKQALSLLPEVPGEPQVSGRAHIWDEDREQEFLPDAKSFIPFTLCGLPILPEYEDGPTKKSRRKFETAGSGSRKQLNLTCLRCRRAELAQQIVDFSREVPEGAVPGDGLS